MIEKAQAGQLSREHLAAVQQELERLPQQLEPAPAAPDHDECLGRGLAELHRSGGEPGLDRDNFVGTLLQDNRTCANWCEFYIERRLRPLVLAPWQARFERLFAALPGWLPNEALSRLHGDLWAGNVVTGPGGEPCLIDPAVYVGHREVDLAMMRFFGGFGPRVWASYQEAFPLSHGYECRSTNSTLCSSMSTSSGAATFEVLGQGIAIGQGFLVQLRDGEGSAVADLHLGIVKDPAHPLPQRSYFPWLAPLDSYCHQIAKPPKRAKCRNKETPMKSRS